MKKPTLIALVLVLVVGGWVASGLIKSDSSASGDMAATETDLSQSPLIVEATTMTARKITPLIVAHGNLVPDRVVELKTETDGRVEEVLVDDGDAVTAGQALVRLRLNDRLIRREQAELKIEEKQRQYDAVVRLQERGFGSQSEVDTARVELKMAEVELAQVELEIENTTITAPFAGIVDQMLVEEGQYLGIGNDVLTVVDNTPLIVDVMVPQQHVHRLSLGQQVQVTLADGEEVQGSIRFISSLGQESTRTFRVEVEIANDGHLRAGGSATAYIPEDEVDAHFVSGGLLTLDDDGQMGVKTVDNTGLVSFWPVIVEYSEANGMWVSGLPHTARIIVSGQGFAEVGERVQVNDMPPRTNMESGAGSVPGGRVNADIN